MSKIKRLPGMQDLSQSSWDRLVAVQSRIRRFFSLYGYQTIETPLLEPTELFLRKSGGELASRMYTFVDPGGHQASLRPEFTASVVRHYLECSPKPPVPWRVQYGGPVFRYNNRTTDSIGGSSDELYQFYQAGAELLGPDSPQADAEILEMALGAMTDLGSKDHKIRLGDVGLFYAALDTFNLSERAKIFLLSSIPVLRNGQSGLDETIEKAHALHLLDDSVASGALGRLQKLITQGEMRDLLKELFQETGVVFQGNRSPEAILDRLQRKLNASDEPKKMQRGLELCSQLAQVTGEPAQVLPQIEAILRYFRVDLTPVQRLYRIMDFLSVQTSPELWVEIDLGLARGVAYYTGVVFEIEHPVLGSLGGGGRYDGLCRALGGTETLPALGLALTIEQAQKLSTHEKSRQDLISPEVLVISLEGEAYLHAFKLVQDLHKTGIAAEIEVCDRSIDSSLEYARARSISKVIGVYADGNSETMPFGK